jgi:FKBP-type peptidyl-prolyl cis-trans isomerase 2
VAPAETGAAAPVANAQCRRCLVRVVALPDKAVVVDANPRWAGRALELEVKLLGIEAPAAGTDSPLV